MPFRFSLQEVLDYRKRIEEVRQREMLRVLRNVEYVEGLIEQARGQRADYRHELNRVAQKGLSYAHQQIYTDYLQALDGLIAQSEEHLESMRAELERRRSRLLAASRERQVLDELRKAEQREYLTAQTRIENKEFDEIAIRNFSLAARDE